MSKINGGGSSFLAPILLGVLDYNSHRVGGRPVGEGYARQMGGLVTLPETTTPVMQCGS